MMDPQNFGLFLDSVQDSYALISGQPRQTQRFYKNKKYEAANKPKYADRQNTILKMQRKEPLQEKTWPAHENGVVTNNEHQELQFEKQKNKVLNTWGA